MAETELYKLAIFEAAELLRQRKISAVELTQAHLERIRAVEDKIRAFTLVTDDLALSRPKRQIDVLTMEITSTRLPAFRSRSRM